MRSKAFVVLFILMFGACHAFSSQRVREDIGGHVPPVVPYDQELPCGKYQANGLFMVSQQGHFLTILNYKTRMQFEFLVKGSKKESLRSSVGKKVTLLGNISRVRAGERSAEIEVIEVLSSRSTVKDSLRLIEPVCKK